MKGGRVLIKKSLEKYIPLLVFILLSVKVNSQICNYVSNGGIEELHHCTPFPVNWPGIDSTTNYPGIIFSPRPCYANVPTSNYGYQFPKEGDNFIGVMTYCKYDAIGFCPPGGNRQYLKNRLKQTLIQGKAYCVKFYVNLMESSSFASDSYGACFGDESLDTIKTCFTPLTYLNPQIQNAPGNFITDTIGWTLVSGTYTANGTEKYMVIGNFKSNTATDTLRIKPSPYAFINSNFDLISCIPLDLPANAGPDIYSATGNSVYIGRPREAGLNEACIWYKLPNMIPIDTSAGIWVSVPKTTTFVVIQNICGNVTSDTVALHMNLSGISELNNQLKHLQLFPVPAKNYIELKTQDNELLIEFRNIAIYNNLNQLLMEEELDSENPRVSLENFSDGVYYLQLKNNKGKTLNKRFVIAR